MLINLAACMSVHEGETILKVSSFSCNMPVLHRRSLFSNNWGKIYLITLTSRWGKIGHFEFDLQKYKSGRYCESSLRTPWQTNLDLNPSEFMMAWRKLQPQQRYEVLDLNDSSTFKRRLIILLRSLIDGKLKDHKVIKNGFVPGHAASVASVRISIDSPSFLYCRHQHYSCKMMVVERELSETSVQNLPWASS